MDIKKHRLMAPPYQFTDWLDDERDTAEGGHASKRLPQSRTHPDVQDQSRLLELLGRINYKILTGERVYLEFGGVVYKTLYGAYWRSVITGIEHYLLKCEQISGWMGSEESASAALIDLPIVYSNDGWTASGHRLSLMITPDH